MFCLPLYARCRTGDQRQPSTHQTHWLRRDWDAQHLRSLLAALFKQRCSLIPCNKQFNANSLPTPARSCIAFLCWTWLPPVFLYMCGHPGLATPLVCVLILSSAVDATHGARAATRHTGAEDIGVTFDTTAPTSVAAFSHAHCASLLDHGSLAGSPFSNRTRTLFVARGVWRRGLSRHVACHSLFCPFFHFTCLL